MCEEGYIGDWEASLATAERDGRETRSFLNLLTCMDSGELKSLMRGTFLSKLTIWGWAMLMNRTNKTDRCHWHPFEESGKRWIYFTFVVFKREGVAFYSVWAPRIGRVIDVSMQSVDKALKVGWYLSHNISAERTGFDVTLAAYSVYPRDQLTIQNLFTEVKR